MDVGRPTPNRRFGCSSEEVDQSTPVPGPGGLPISPVWVPGPPPAISSMGQGWEVLGGRIPPNLRRWDRRSIHTQNIGPFSTTPSDQAPWSLRPSNGRGSETGRTQRTKNLQYFHRRRCSGAGPHLELVAGREDFFVFGQVRLFGWNMQ